MDSFFTTGPDYTRARVHFKKLLSLATKPLTSHTQNTTFFFTSRLSSRPQPRGCLHLSWPGQGIAHTNECAKDKSCAPSSLDWFSLIRYGFTWSSVDVYPITFFFAPSESVGNFYCSFVFFSLSFSLAIVASVLEHPVSSSNST